MPSRILFLAVYDTVSGTEDNNKKRRKKVILSNDAELLNLLTYRELKIAIRERRRVIRKSRDERGDDRCWMDNYLIWAMLENSPVDPMKAPAYGEAMQSCEQFYKYCSTEDKDPTPLDAILDPDHWDDDLWGINKNRLVYKLLEIQLAITILRDVYYHRPLTIDDYRNLYVILPEKIPADFRLPPRSEFLGTDNPHAGCPRFWMSHSNCKGPCNLHVWGPCANHQAD